jgi:hypothetical protein
VVVVDSLLPHKGEGGTHELLERWDCNVLYLLPYSLDLNPVEEAVFKVQVPYGEPAHAPAKRWWAPWIGLSRHSWPGMHEPSSSSAGNRLSALSL